jgi:hypothetical protein
MTVSGLVAPQYSVWLVCCRCCAAGAGLCMSQCASLASGRQQSRGTMVQAASLHTCPPPTPTPTPTHPPTQTPGRALRLLCTPALQCMSLQTPPQVQYPTCPPGVPFFWPAQPLASRQLLSGRCCCADSVTLPQKVSSSWHTSTCTCSDECLRGSASEGGGLSAPVTDTQCCGYGCGLRCGGWCMCLSKARS